MVLTMTNPLPPNLANRLHDDWPWPMSQIPRRWTAFNWGLPKLLIGHGLNHVADFTTIWATEGQGSKATIGFVVVFGLRVPKPITTPGSWQLSWYPDAPWWAKPIAWYFAISFARSRENKKFRTFRLGARYDNVDNYVQWPCFPTTRAYTGDDAQNTQDW